MKFVIIASHPQSVISFRGELIALLQSKGFDLHVIIPHLSEDAVINKIRNANVCVHTLRLNRTGLNPFYDLVSLADLFHLLRLLRPSYVLAYTAKPVIYGMFVARIIGIKHRFALITGLGVMFNCDTVKDKILLLAVKQMYKISLLKTQTVFFQNPDDMQLFIENKISNSIQSCVVNGSGVDVDYFKYSVPPIRINFLMLARLMRSKGVLVYFEAARAIKSKYPDVGFMLAGDVDVLNADSISRRELDDIIKSSIIDYYGQIDDVRNVLSDSCVYVLPSFYREGVPRSILEALSTGRAVITTNLPGCKETVVHEKNGYLIEPNSVTDLVNAMMHFINCPNLVQKMGVESRRIAEDKYDVHKVNNFMLQKMLASQ